MPLTSGTRLGPYEILAPLGAGGMGEVYCARDTKLDRQVAVKVLPEAVANDPERLARFEREAKVLASLNHPNIAHVYGVEESNGVRALVMELAPGATLQCPLAVATALDYARQIAEALEAAHEKGITHRDLKPGNIMVTPEGVVKVLDFGLATMANRASASDPASSPTFTMATQAGIIMGTAAYMSPEQAAGKPADHRADIWSFGVVLYEMLAGERLFAGETASETLADVLRAPIHLDHLPKETPRAIRDLLRRCLSRDPRKRLRDIGDARIVIEEVLSGAGGEIAAPDVVSPPSRLAWPLSVAAAILAIALAALSFVHFRERAPAPEVMRFQIPIPVGNRSYKGMAGGSGSSVSTSPDGRQLAFTTLGLDNQRQVWVRSLDAAEPRLLAGTSGATYVFWSPDSRFIAFGSIGELKKVDVSGGPPQVVCDLPTGGFLGGAWAADGAILFAVRTRPLMRVSEAGGTPVPVAASKGSPDQEVVAGFPSWLPDRRHFLYEAWTPKALQAGAYVGSLDALAGPPKTKPLVTVEVASPIVYAPSRDPGFGYILYTHEGSLMALPIDAHRLKPAGAAVPIAEGVQGTSFSFSASATGVLAYRSASPGETDSQLVWFDRQGKRVGHVGPPGYFGQLQLSPDGKVVVVDHVVSQAYTHVAYAETSRGIFSRLNPGDATDYAAGAVSPDGRAAFTYVIGSSRGDLYVKALSGAGTAELLVGSAKMKHPNHWSLDGRYIVYDEHTPQKEDLWIVPMAGNRKPIPFLVTPADERDANFSPDTRWMAYSSDESGRHEVYVQGFVPDHVPAAGIGKWQISTAGGSKPRWRRDGKELYYLAPDGMLMAVPVNSTATTFEPGVAVPLFQTHTRGWVPYDVAPDGRFLIDTMPDDETNPAPLMVVLNWTAGLKK